MAATVDRGRKRSTLSNARYENKAVAQFNQGDPAKNQAEPSRTTKATQILITGGAGFIWSHLSDDLMLREFNVMVLDNLSNGRLQDIEKWLGS
jgi:FlaA1/EpsC-like NDP-sugar epimerase